MTCHHRITAAALLIIGLGISLYAGAAGAQDRAAQSKELPVDPYERNAEFWAFERIGKSGWQRGQEIFYMRCWMCHNEYAIAAEPGSVPTLRDLYKRNNLLNRQPVNDQTVAARIRAGSQKMPRYTPATLSDRDMSDLLAYLKEKCGTFPTGGGCFDEHNPPRNPRYKQ